MRDNTKKHRQIIRRSFLMIGGKLFLWSILCSRFFWLQLLEGHKYSSLSEKNRIRKQFISQGRGLILDKNALELAVNITTYKVILNAAFSKDIRSILSSINKILSSKIEISSSELYRAIHYNERYMDSVVLCDHLTFRDVAKLETHLELSGKIQIMPTLTRFYNHGSLFAHIIGYVAKPSQQELKKRTDTHWQYARAHGKSGIEKVFDDSLQGVPTTRKIEVNSLGHFTKELEVIHGCQGRTIELSIDGDLQAKARYHIGANIGSSVLLDITTGEVLVLYSSPSYDPNQFVTGISKRNWNDLVNDGNKPLINKCIAAVYPPGSTFKPVTALALLNSGVDPSMRVFCSGEYKLFDRTFHCWKQWGHGSVNLEMALSQSCNVYFYIQAAKIGMKKISEAAKRLGLGHRTGIELTSESIGLIPDDMWKSRYMKNKWRTGDTVNASIGQGYNLVTPIQLAVMIGRIASGVMLKPTLIKNSCVKKEPLQGVGQAELSIIRKGLYKVFNDPSGISFQHHFSINGMEIAGKTGTAQVISQRKLDIKSRYKEHGLFVGFFPYHKPRYAISTIIEHSSWGSRDALPISCNIIKDAAQLLS